MSINPFLRPSAAGFVRGPRVADRMTTQMHLDLRNAIAAERAGDAFAARELHARIPMFRRSGHQVVLRHLSALSQEMTPWLWSRWAVYQASRIDDGSRAGCAVRGGLSYVLPALHDAELARLHAARGDDMSVMARVLGQSWVLHQLSVYDLGGLVGFLDEQARGPLAEHASLARTWALAPMGGYQLVAPSDDGLHVQDLATGSTRPLLDLGARTHAAVGEFVIGRLMPSGTEPALMFDTRPLRVDEATARSVAARPMPSDWFDVLADAVQAGRTDPSPIESEDRELASDVAGLAMLDRGTPAARRAAVRQSLASGRDEIGRAAYRVLRQVAEGTWGEVADDGRDPETDAAYVAAAIVNPHAHEEAWRLLATATPAHRWARWAELVPDPARGRLQRLAGAAALAS